MEDEVELRATRRAAGRTCCTSAACAWGTATGSCSTTPTCTWAYGERAVLVGANGAGKTTLLRCIMGMVAPQAGEIKLGRGVRPGYMAQEQETLDAAATPFELVR